MTDLDALIAAARAAGITVPEQPVGDPPAWVDYPPEKAPVGPPPLGSAPNRTTEVLAYDNTMSLVEVLGGLRKLAAKGVVHAAEVAVALTPFIDVLDLFEINYDGDEMTLDGPDPRTAAWEEQKREHKAAMTEFAEATAAWKRKNEARRDADRAQLAAKAPWFRWNKFVEQCRKAAEAQHDPQATALAALGRALPPKEG